MTPPAGLETEGPTLTLPRGGSASTCRLARRTKAARGGWQEAGTHEGWPAGRLSEASSPGRDLKTGVGY